MRSHDGFTLIEVLVALAIIAIALTAIIKATSQNIQNTLYLQNKTIATWVGKEIMTRAQTGILKLPTPPDSITLETTMLHQKWNSQVTVTNTPNSHIKKINIDILQHDKKLTSLEGYLYAD